ncbi:protein kinase family protein [Dermacoccus sp. PAMC28757]|uniref:protein kinase family protein n=1 Tax=Dermacoccus sp. PAMC28757 TaxID=2762331 RepID=UPI00164DE284|nr:protein kinase family protein [Dermacoccus sp. PAMC28757]QNK53339.1 protein kinase family protein [Dermacoccus sp. PAMC28757]
MQGITKGTVLGNRYELTSEISDAPGLARWLARDEKLGREVAITVFGSKSSHAAAALDSARRAAGVEDDRLVRVLDAGSDDDHSFVVEEAHTGAHSLADLVRFEAMHPEEARRIVGETASALEAARQRGLHHLTLSPRHVLRLADGSIAVTQVAVGGALAGRDDISSAEATKRDAAACVKLLYTALTGEWPGKAEEITGLKGLTVAERRADGQIATPSEVVDGIPSDLDTMCRQSLNYDETPRTPGEVARQLAPWSAQMITAPGKGRRSDDAAGDEDEKDQNFTVRRAADRTEGEGRRGVGAVGAAALAAAGTAGAAKGARRLSNADDDTDPGARAEGPRAALPRKPAPRAANEQDPADATMIGRPVQFDADETTQFSLDDEDAAYHRTTYDPSFEELEPPVPGFHGGTDDPDAGSSKLALGIVALFVIGALVLAVLGIRGIGGNADTPAASNSGSASSGAASSGASPSGSASRAGTPVKVQSASVVNQRGMRVNDSSSMAQAVDGDTSTAWKSLLYRNRPWGGYPGYGGLALNLGTSTDVKSIKITPGEGQPLTADVYVGDAPGTAGKKVGSVSNATSQQTISSTAKGSYVTIFITTQSLAPGTSYYQSAVSEVSVEK